LGLKCFIGNGNGVSYEFELKRKVSILRGDSGTGKTVLYEMVQESRDPSLGIVVHCKYKLYEYHRIHRNNIGDEVVVFIDEDTLKKEVRAVDLAKEIENSRYYWVLISRYDYPEISYSMDAILKVVGNKRHRLVRLYEFGNREMVSRPDRVITEDSRSGKKLAQLVYGEMAVKSAGGSGNINIIMEGDNRRETTLYIVDAEGYGPYIKRSAELIEKMANKYILAPYSTEYILMKSGMFDRMMEKLMPRAGDVRYIARVCSWERLLTRLLTEWSRETPASYVKDRLKSCYYTNCCNKNKLSKGKCRLYCRVNKMDRIKRIFERMEGKGDGSRLL
jgi:hypothetical protein